VKVSLQRDASANGERKPAAVLAARQPYIKLSRPVLNPAFSFFYNISYFAGITDTGKDGFNGI